MAFYFQAPVGLHFHDTVCIFCHSSRPATDRLTHDKVSVPVAQQSVGLPRLSANTVLPTRHALHRTFAVYVYLLHSVPTPRPVVPKLFRSDAPLVPYAHPQRPPTFFKKYKCAFISTFILYLKNCLNKIIRVKLNVLC